MPAVDPVRHAENSARWRKANPDRSNQIGRQSALRKLEAKAGRPCPELCEICDKPDKAGRRLAFDHDHKTGEFRGWICISCNNALGRIGDDPVLARKLADYLEKGFTKRDSQGYESREGSSSAA